MRRALPALVMFVLAGGGVLVALAASGAHHPSSGGAHHPWASAAIGIAVLAAIAVVGLVVGPRLRR